jgi:hypothetical protein
LVAPNLPYGVAEGEGDGEASLFFLVVSFLVVVALVSLAADSFLVVDFLVVDFLVVEAGAFSGAVVVVDDSVLVVHELMSPAANRTVME